MDISIETIDADLIHYAGAEMSLPSTMTQTEWSQISLKCVVILLYVSSIFQLTDRSAYPSLNDKKSISFLVIFVCGLASALEQDTRHSVCTKDERYMYVHCTMGNSSYRANKLHFILYFYPSNKIKYNIFMLCLFYVTLLCVRKKCKPELSWIIIQPATYSHTNTILPMSQ